MSSDPKALYDGNVQNKLVFADVKPQVPVRPILSLAAFGREKGKSASLLDAGNYQLTVNARAAIALAFRYANIGEGCSVLVPAYHCPAMVSPMAWLGVEPIFFPIRPDTTVDPEVLARYIRPNTRAMIAVHYFGFIHDFSPLRKFCDERNILLIEDCAHAFFGGNEQLKLGRHGDFAIASIMKFIPADDGGCLASARQSLASMETKPGNLLFQLKSALNILEVSCHYGRLWLLRYPLKLKKWLWNKAKKKIQGLGRASGENDVFEESDDEFRFEPSSLGLKMSWPSIFIMKAMSFSGACASRRANYLTWMRSFTGISGCRPLFDDLPEGIYPQVFPLLVDDPVSLFSALKSKGVPIVRFGEYRWKGVEGVCPVSDDLSRRVLQFPCHQALLPSELEWMIQMVKAAL